MASGNLSDMHAKRLLNAAFNIRAPAATSVANQPTSALLTHLAKLSTYDKPAAPTIEENTYYDKYREKLEKIKQSKPQEYEAAMKKIYGEKNKPAEAKQAESDVKGSSVLERMKSSSVSHSQTPQSSKRKSLDSIIKLELLQDKSSEEIGQIWNQYYATKENVLFATLPVGKYHRLREKGNECPMFVYALPRESGYEFMLGQCTNDDWYFTPLLAYQTHGEYAPYSLSVQYYTELADARGIVLMKGEISQEDLKPELATLLVHQTQFMYGSEENFKLVKSMHTNPNEFKHMDIVELCKKAGIF